MAFSFTSSRQFAAGGTPSPAASAKVRAHQRASQQGNVVSMLAIGDGYYYGRGVERDWPMAFRVYTSASRFRNAQVSHALESLTIPLHPPSPLASTSLSVLS